MNKRQALVRALLGIIVFDFIKITRPPSLRATDDVKLYVMGIFLFLIAVCCGIYITFNMNDPAAIFWGILIGFFLASWFTYASEIIKDRYHFMNRLKQIENIMYD